MCPQEDPRNRLYDELESIRKRVGELQALVADPLPGIEPADGQGTALPLPVHTSWEEIVLPEILDAGPLGMAVQAPARSAALRVAVHSADRSE
jgi:hypothetical protein